MRYATRAINRLPKKDYWCPYSKYHAHINSRNEWKFCCCGANITLELKLKIDWGYRKVIHTHKRNDKYPLD